MIMSNGLKRNTLYLKMFPSRSPLQLSMIGDRLRTMSQSAPHTYNAKASAEYLEYGNGYILWLIFSVAHSTTPL